MEGSQYSVLALFGVTAAVAAFLAAATQCSLLTNVILACMATILIAPALVDVLGGDRP
jgi:hypothetical protein